MNKDQVKGYLIKLLLDEKMNDDKIEELVEKLDTIMSEIKPSAAAAYYYEAEYK